MGRKATSPSERFAAVAQLEERQLAKLKVGGSKPLCRSRVSLGGAVVVNGTTPPSLKWLVVKKNVQKVAKLFCYFKICSYICSKFKVER